MTAPTRTRTADTRGTTSTRTAKTPQKRASRATNSTATRSAAAERAYARRERATRTVPQPAKQRARKPGLSAKVTHARGPFVITVMSLLAAGLVATLWLATAGVSGSYELRQADSELNSLQERKEVLMREVSTLDSTPALERRAAEAGLVPAPEPAHLRANPDGTVAVVGDPKPAEAPEPPKPPEHAPPPADEAGVPPMSADR